MEILCAVMAWYIVGLASCLYAECHDRLDSTFRPVLKLVLGLLCSLLGPVILAFAIRVAYEETKK